MKRAALLATASWLAVEVLRLSVVGCWVLVTVWVWSAAIIYALRFRQGKWRSMRVIEKDAVSNEEIAAAVGE